MLTSDVSNPFENMVSLKIRTLFVVYVLLLVLLLLLLLVWYYKPVRSKTSRFPGITVLFIKCIGFEVLTGAIMKSTLFWDVKHKAHYSLGLFFHPEDGGNVFFRKTSELPNYDTTSQR
jgi:hypothetical protein